MAAKPETILAGMNVAVGRPSAFHVVRTHANRWLLACADEAVARAVEEADQVSLPPSSVVDNASLPSDRFAAVAQLELDRCGAWVTATIGSGARPLVVRRAGWVDVRGDRGPHAGDDRVGLGPEDSLVFFDTATACDDGGVVGDDVLDSLLAVAGYPASDQLAACEATGATVAAVIRVPETGHVDPLERLVEATGIEASELQLPGYPLGDAQPDLWKEPPTPPRHARLLVRPEVANVPRVRDLLRRLLASWRIEDRVEADDVLVIATEVAANAVLHANTDAYAVIRYLGDSVRVEVEDYARALPRVIPVEESATSGRGLHLVGALSASWGVRTTPSGKSVWFEVPVSHPPDSPA